jgi:hypothetical protein
MAGEESPGTDGKARNGKAGKETKGKPMTKKEEDKRQVIISKPNMQTMLFTIVGTAPYVQNKFSAKAQQMIRDKQQAGEAAKNKTKKQAKDFLECYEGAKHISTEGWCGIPAPAFRSAAVSACRVAGFAMTRAKLSVFIEPDGLDKDDGTPLVKITKGEPEYFEAPVRLPKGETDIRARPMWKPGWEAELRVTFDADQFTMNDVANLIMRVGMQAGIGEGRPDSKSSCGMGWGLFRIKDR